MVKIDGMEVILKITMGRSLNPRVLKQIFDVASDSSRKKFVKLLIVPERKETDYKGNFQSVER